MTDLNRFALLLPCLLLLAAMTPRAQEIALDAELRRLEQSSASPARRERVQKLTQLQELSRRPHPEHPALDLPYFDLTARAQALLERWDEQTYFSALKQHAHLRSKRVDKHSERRALLRWIQQATAAELEHYRSQRPFRSQPEAIQRSLCVRQDRLSDWLSLASSAQEAQSLRAISQRSLAMDQDKLQQLLAAMSPNPALSGARASLLKAWQARHPNQWSAQPPASQQLNQDWLMLALANPPVDLTQILSEALYQADQPELAAWGLWKLGDAQALQILRQYSVSAQAIPHLASEIQSWLP